VALPGTESGWTLADLLAQQPMEQRVDGHIVIFHKYLGVPYFPGAFESWNLTKTSPFAHARYQPFSSSSSHSDYIYRKSAMDRLPHGSLCLVVEQDVFYPSFLYLRFAPNCALSLRLAISLSTSVASSWPQGTTSCMKVSGVP